MSAIIIFLNIFCKLIIASPIVELDDGLISGKNYSLTNGRQIFVFYGVPYAAPPILENRFEAPQKVKSWQGVLKCSLRPNQCAQMSRGTYFSGEEDCLYLNVFTPKLPDGDDLKLDVMVFIHGGTFSYGTAHYYRPDYIMEENDLVYVSINYRLGPLGFFSTGDTVIPGNNGMKDQIAALKWVRQNIRKFGGNPDSVTIMGQSSGATAVQYHYLSPLSEGLFHKGITSSGSVLASWTLPPNNTQRSLELAGFVGCSDSNTTILVNCLKNKTARMIVEATRSFYHWKFSPFTVLGPVVEPLHDGAFLIEEPVKSLENGRVKDLPFLVTLSRDEGIFPSILFVNSEKDLKELDEKWLDLAPDLLMYSYSISSKTERDKVSSAIRKYYFGNKSISVDTMKEIIQMNGDRKYVNDITRSTKLHAAVTSENIFCLKFSYRGKYSISDAFGGKTDIGVGHSDICNYIVTFLPYSSKETTSDIEMGKFISSICIEFMRTGDPRIQNISWIPVSKNLRDNFNCLEVFSPTEVEMTEYLNKDVIEFWRNLIPSEHPTMKTKKHSHNEL